METFFYDKLEKWETTKRRDRETNCEALGQQMIDAGNAFGPGTSYGAPLTRCLFYYFIDCIAKLDQQTS